MNKFQRELIEGITEVATTTDLTVNQCIREALEMLKKDKREYAEMLQDEH